jgi:hypothetical protein
MTVGRLLTEASSYELSEWQAYLTVDARVREDAVRRSREERQIMGSD